MQDKRTDVLYGSLGLIILKTLEALGPLHGYRIARRIEQISGDHLALNQGTLYPALLRLEQAGWIRSAWGESDSGRAVKIYALTRTRRPICGWPSPRSSIVRGSCPVSSTPLPRRRGFRCASTGGSTRCGGRASRST